MKLVNSKINILSRVLLFLFIHYVEVNIAFLLTICAGCSVNALIRLGTHLPYVKKKPSCLLHVEFLLVKQRILLFERHF